MGYSQLDTTIIYRVKEIHNITLGGGTAIKWTIDTIKYDARFEIKFTKKRIYVDGYGSFGVNKYETRGDGGDLRYRWYALSNGAYLMWVLNVVIIEYPMVNRKLKTLVFNIE